MKSWNCKSGKIIVTDPYSEKPKDTDVFRLSVILDNCEIGEWTTDVIKRNQGDSNDVNDRIEFLCTSYKNAPAYESGEWKNIGLGIGVDVGMVGIFDEKYYPDDPDELDKFSEEVSSLIGGVAGFTTVKRKDIVMGCASSSGWGDGIYDCYIRKNAKNKIDGVIIDYGISPICDMIGQRGGDYFHKYKKYKSKYLGLKNTM